MIPSWDIELHNINIETFVTVPKIINIHIHISLIKLVYYYLVSRHIYSQLPNMCQSWDLGLDNLYCGKWRQISKSCCELDLNQTIPSVGLVRAIFIYYNMLKLQVDWTIIFIVYTDSRTAETQTDRHTDTQTDMSTLQLRLINHI